MAVEQINKLTDNDNFGEWLVKLNEVISKLNTNLRTTDENKETIDKAFSSGQIGEAISVSSYDSCLHSGMYHINTSSPANVYVASNGSCVTQIAVTEELYPTISIRNGNYSVDENGDLISVSFSEWKKLTDKTYTDSTFLPFTGGTINGSLVVEGNTSTTTLSSGNTNISGEVTLSNESSVLSITNNKDNIIFDGNKNKSPHTLYYINKDSNAVSTDYEGKDIKYYLHTDNNGTKTLVHYNIEYFIQKHLDTLNDYNTDKKLYYIQSDGRITIAKNDTIAQFYKEGHTFLNLSKDKLEYFAKDNEVYDYTTQFYVSNNEVFIDSLLENKVYDIEDTEVVYYTTPFFIEENVVKSSENKEVVYYIHINEESNIKYLSSVEDGSIVDYFLTENGVYSDEECTTLVYSIENENIVQRNIMYYIHIVKDMYENTYTMWSVDVEGNIPALYIFKDEVILLETLPKYVIRKYKDTLSADKEGMDTRFYIQSDGRITSDLIGTQINYLFIDDFVASIYTPDTVAFYVWNDKLITHTTIYYIQNNGNVTSDEEGMNVCYKYDEENSRILNIKYPISIDLFKNVCDINGTSERANYLSAQGLTHSFTTGDTSLAASGKAVMDLNESIKGKYIPFTGGIFTGLVSHTEDILLGKMAKIRAYDKLNFHSLGEISFIVNSDSGQIYIDRQNVLDTDSLQPCVFGARIRDGITESENGSVLYALGSLEFTEESTRLRFRKTNLTNVEDSKDEENDISLYLNTTEFYPSKNRTVTLGKSGARFNNIYAYKSSITSSDESLKTSITEVDKTLLKKWKDISWKTYKFKSSVEEKGEKARLHAGLIAQEVKKILSKVDATKYGFFCEDEDGLSLRYQEIQAIENAYLREEIKTLKEEIKELKKLLK